MNKEETIKKALNGVITAGDDILDILENSDYYADLRSWFNPNRCGLKDKYLATLSKTAIPEHIKRNCEDLKLILKSRD